MAKLKKEIMNLYSVSISSFLFLSMILLSSQVSAVSTSLEEKVRKLEARLETIEERRDLLSGFKIHGYIQSFYRWNELPSTQNSFDIRRAFITVDSNVNPKVQMRIQADVAASTDQLRDAFIKLLISNKLFVRIGQGKIPFSEEQLTPAKKLKTIYRSLVTRSLSTDRDQGFLIGRQPKKNGFIYSFGVFNGNGRNASDDNDSKDGIVRVALKQGVIMLGGAGQYGEQLVNGINRSQIRWGSVGKISSKKFSVQGEYIHLRKKVSHNNSTDSSGWYILGIIDLFDEIQPILKYEQFDANLNQPMDRVDSITMGINMKIMKDVLFQSNYIMNREQIETNNDEFIAQIQMEFSSLLKSGPDEN